jgi:hypothetical protein
MVRRWQLWLWSRPLQRRVTSSERHILGPHSAALYEFLTDDNGRWTIRETLYINNKIVREGLSGPPL